MSADDQILALISGLPKSRWSAWRIMVMQAYIDDSGSEPQSRLFVLAGFAASPQQWIDFNIAWEKVLNEHPTLEYFKSNEAYGLKKQFDKKRGWTEETRDARIMDLAKVIRKYAPERFAVAVSNEDYKKYLSGIPIKNRFDLIDTPYFWLFCNLMLIVAAFHSVKSKIDTCDFIFDKQGKIGTRAINWWETFKAGSMKTAKFDFTPYLGQLACTRFG